MENKYDIISETLDRFADHNVKESGDLFDVFLDEFNYLNNMRINAISNIYDDVSTIVEGCFVFAIAGFLLNWYDYILGAISLCIIAFVSVISLIYFMYKYMIYKKILINSMNNYSEFLMNLFLNHNPDYEDRDINGVNWQGFIKRCKNYTKLAIKEK